MAAVTERQLAFFRALAAPFTDIKTRPGTRGAVLSYISARQLFNRLDEVAGPAGWTIHYRSSEHGIIAVLAIRCPDNQEGWEWIEKEDGGGFAGMEKPNGELNEEDDWKSGFSDAAKRAGVAWGIGRHLYRDGVPAWMTAAPLTQPEPRAKPAERAPAPQSRETAAPNPRSAPPQRPTAAIKFPALPPKGGVFRWVKSLESRFKESYLNKMIENAKAAGHGERVNDWNEDVIRDMCGGLVEYLKSREDYAGEFDDPGEAEAAAKLRSEIVWFLSKWHKQRTEREATPEQIRAYLADLSPNAETGRGVAGVVVEDLTTVTDVVWLKNILTECGNLKAITEGVPF
jgi:hypothetical protein